MYHETRITSQPIASEFFALRYGRERSQGRRTNGAVSAGEMPRTSLHMIGAGDAFKLVGRQTAGASIHVENLVPHGRPPTRLRHCKDEAIVVLDGMLRLRVGERTILAGPGSCLFVPQGTIHQFRQVRGALPS